MKNTARAVAPQRAAKIITRFPIGLVYVNGRIILPERPSYSQLSRSIYADFFYLRVKGVHLQPNTVLPGEAPTKSEHDLAANC